MELFDFNRDGNTDLGESMLGMGILGLFAQMEGEERWQNIAGEEAESLSDDIEEALEALEARKSELEDALLELESEEPDDVCSGAYERWEARRDALEDEISDLEDNISEYEDALEL